MNIINEIIYQQLLKETANLGRIKDFASKLNIVLTWWNPAELVANFANHQQLKQQLLKKQ